MQHVEFKFKETPQPTVQDNAKIKRHWLIIQENEINDVCA